VPGLWWLVGLLVADGGSGVVVFESKACPSFGFG